MELTPRKKQILSAIIEAYVATAEPVGSKTLLASANLDISSATIRNEMADLTELGYLEQPHTSAGRIPSPLGYRLYVNELMGSHQLTADDTQSINDALNLKIEELDRVIDRAGKVLSQISDYPVFSMASAKKQATVRRYDLLLVDENSFIVVVMTDGNLVKNKIIRSDETVTETQLQLLSTVLSSSFTALSLPQLEEALEQMRLRSAPNAYELISQVVTFAISVLSNQELTPPKTTGIANLLEYPEYSDVDKAKPLMALLTENTQNLGLSVAPMSGTNILIGPENINEALKDTSVVMASYDIGDDMQGV
ncbi:MAG: heat-inducible transcriptional repressor HrcA, partial [Eubacteriales bacterium]